MAEHVVDLKLDRSLIDSQFDGYKLSLDPLPVYKSQLQEEADIAKLSEDQHSYQHIRAFGLTNHIIPDHWDSNNVYVVNQEWEVLKISIPLETSPDAGIAVFTIPGATEKRKTKGRHNVTVQFVSEDRAVLSDGTGSLFILETGPRTGTCQKWKILHQCEPLENQMPFVLSYCCYKSGEKSTVECLVLHVEETAEERKAKNSAPFETVVDWLSFIFGEKEWSLSRHRTLVSNRCPEYLSIDEEAIILCNQQKFRFLYDSVEPVVVEPPSGNQSQTEASTPEYTWSQTDEDLTVLFTVPEEVNKADIYMNLHPQQIELGVKNSRVLLQGALEGQVDIDGSTWTIEKGRITLTLCKSESKDWQVVVLGDSRGEMVMDPEQIAAIHNRLSQLTSEEWNPDPKLLENRPYNSQELEECDAFAEDNAVLQRIDGNSHKVTHQVDVSSHQWLFNIQIKPDSLPAICLRHDVDGVIWQSMPLTDADPTKLFKHYATFNAFGYVQASKQQKRFCTAPPDMSYAVIADCVRHIYLYRQPEAISSPLRNRKTGRQVKAVAKQQLASLECVDDILGIHATNERLYVLAGKTFHVIKIN